LTQKEILKTLKYYKEGGREGGRGEQLKVEVQESCD